MRAVEDFEAVVQAARRATGVPAERTVISGRSAGGIIVGALVARHGDGDLFGAAFAEVPYVDLLRTTTNPDLALTTVEYNEFGDPARRIVDFVTALGVSPIDQVAGRGAPGVFVLARTGGNDTQVYPYEPLKWARRLREGPATDMAGKLLGYVPDEGHFYSPAADLAARSTDLALLDAWVDNPVVRKKIAAISITTQMMNMRKSRKNNMRKSRKNDMPAMRKAEGGKRRKARATRKARKTRRAHRK
jgi:prolyl oligopeptidase PreP (S9A serine peptidase family)